MRITVKDLNCYVDSLNARTGKQFEISQRNGYIAIDTDHGRRNIIAGLTIKETFFFLRGMLETCYELNITQD